MSNYTPLSSITLLLQSSLHTYSKPSFKKNRRSKREQEICSIKFLLLQYFHNYSFLLFPLLTLSRKVNGELCSYRFVLRYYALKARVFQRWFSKWFGAFCLYLKMSAARGVSERDERTDTPQFFSRHFRKQVRRHNMKLYHITLTSINTSNSTRFFILQGKTGFIMK